MYFARRVSKHRLIELLNIVDHFLYSEIRGLGRNVTLVVLPQIRPFDLLRNASVRNTNRNTWTDLQSPTERE